MGYAFLLVRKDLPREQVYVEVYKPDWVYQLIERNLPHGNVQVAITSLFRHSHCSFISAPDSFPNLGRSTLKVEPLPGLLQTLTVPLWSLTIPCTTDRPMPVPSPCLVLKNGSKKNVHGMVLFTEKIKVEFSASNSLR